MARLGLDVAFGDVDLHVQSAVDPAAESLVPIAFDEEILVERGDAGQPGIAQRASVDEVQMGVEESRNSHGGRRANGDEGRHDNHMPRRSSKRAR